MYYSLKTTNKSFVDMWRYLQRENVENNLFMLQTHDKDLVDFSIEKYKNMDREDPNFLVYRSKIIEESKNNIWFYFRELVVVPDENGGYKHFELNPTSMMMIYLYEKEKSFINTDLINSSLTLHFLWNYHRSLYNTDIVLVNKLESVDKISSDIKRHIAHMECQVPLGSSQIMSDDRYRYVISDFNSFKNYYNTKECEDELYYIKILRSFIKERLINNLGTKSTYRIFILETDMCNLPYAQLDTVDDLIVCLNIMNKDRVGSGVAYKSIEYKEKATSKVYDTKDDELQRFYVI